jgi:hypothetical protein
MEVLICIAIALLLAAVLWFTIVIINAIKLARIFYIEEETEPVE